MYFVMHHEDDGTEAEYWAVCDDSVCGSDAIGEICDNEKEAQDICDRLNGF